MSIVIRHAGTIVASTRTREDGTFEIRGMRAGIHAIVADNSVAAVRIWTNKAAPPHAKPRAVVVAAPRRLRAQGETVFNVAETLIDVGVVVGIGVVSGTVNYERGRDKADRQSP